MKPCSKNRKLIAWLALDALEARKAAALREHFVLCEGCRRYWEEISNVTERLAAPDSNLEASKLFHRRLAEKLQEVESGSLLERLAGWVGGARLNWRVALPAMAVVVLALAVVVAPPLHPALPKPADPTAPFVSASRSEYDLAPTLANYQMMANQSLDKLSELLTRQGNKSLPPAPVYTASSFQLGEGAF